MKNIITLLSVILFVIPYNSNAQIFWTENFESGSTSGELVTAYTGPNGTWTQTITGTEGASPNPWYVSCAENGHTSGVCGTGCVAVSPTATLATLHIGSTILGDMGASYYAGPTPNASTDRRAESPTINCTGKYTITLNFYYIMDGQAGDDYATVWYYDGTTWSLLASPGQTAPICPGGQGLWTAYSIALPVSANNNPSVKLGFRWVNNNDGIGTDPSFAVDSVNLSTPVGTTTATASFTGTPSYLICQDSSITFTNTSTGSVDSFRWSIPGVTIATATVSPVIVPFTTAGVFTMTLTDYLGGTPYTATHTITVNPTPHPVIHILPGNVLSVTGAYTGYQWASGSPIPAPIAGATSSSYTATVDGSYYIGVDSAGCEGYSPVAFVFSTTGLYQLSNSDNNYWLAQSGNSGTIKLYAGQLLANGLNVLVYDATGRVIIRDSWLQGTNEKEINGAGLSPGLYIIKLSNRNTSTILKWLK